MRFSRFSRLARALRERPRLARVSGRPRRASNASGLELLVSYAVESDLPIETSAVSSEYAEIATNDARHLTVSLPLEFSFEPDGNGGYALSTSPRDVGAVLTNLVGGCCSPVLSANGFRWTCAADCGCSVGEHVFEFYVTYEGYMLFQWWEGWCACRDEGDVTETGRLSLDLPDTLFENTDCDVVQDGFNSDFGSQIVWGEDDLGRGRLRLATGTGGGTLRYVGTSGFVGDVYEGDAADDVLANGTEWALQSGAGLFKGFWLDAGAVSPSYRRGRVTASWTPEGGAASTVTKRFTITPIPAIRKMKSTSILLPHITINASISPMSSPRDR